MYCKTAAIFLALITFIYSGVSALDNPGTQNKDTPKVPPVVHSQIGDSSAGVEGSLKLINIGKLQQYSAAQKSTYDTDIFSPKSASFSPDGALFYINSLEGCKTVAYDARTLEKKHVIEHTFPSGNGMLWAKPSGYYPFTHYKDGETRAFKGKPVESTWSHNGRYLWVPYYRRTFDINAQDPSAIAVIDTDTHTIFRMFETGPLPKMVATSPDGKLIAVTHWGDNTVGFIDISSDNPQEWHHLPPVTVGNKLQLDFPLDSSVDRDSKSGFLLRGTMFTPDSRYLLVSGMGGPLAVIDVAEGKHVGMVQSVYSVRHLAVKDGYLYGSCNVAGSVIKLPLDSLVAGVEKAKTESTKNIRFNGRIETCKVGGGARTLEISPDGKYIFVACNSGNAVYVVDASTMKVADSIRCDSYPVGLALSADGRKLIATSQGRKGYGGNAVNIFTVRRPDMPFVPETELDVEPDTVSGLALIEGTDSIRAAAQGAAKTDGTLSDDAIIAIVAAGAGLVAGGALLLFYPRKKDNDNF